MKRTSFKLFSAMLALVMALAFAGAALAEVPHPELPEHDQEMLLAFWQQEAYDGLTNAEAVYDIDPDAGNGIIEGAIPEYEGGYWTHLLHISENESLGVYYKFLFNYELVDDSFECEEGRASSFNTRVIPFTVKPDLYGKLDLSGTRLRVMQSPDDDQTHITGINVDNCELLTQISIFGQRFCTEISAMNCPQLWDFKAVDCAFTKIDYQPSGYDSAVHMSVFGKGTIGVNYNYWANDNSSILLAYPDVQNFLGWYENGERVSTELEYARAEGGDLVACFGGDADGDGEITATDAILALRAAMHLSQSTEGDEMLDINGSGSVDMADAILILRFAMHLI